MFILTPRKNIGACLILATMCLACNGNKSTPAKNTKHSQRDQATQMMALDLTAESARTTLYHFDLPMEAHQSINTIALQGDAHAVRLYAINRGMLPAHADSIPLYDTASSTVTINPAAAAMLAEPTTRLIFYARRSSVSLQFPMGWGLPLSQDETVLAEVEWQSNGATRHIQIGMVSQRLKPLHPWVAETPSRIALDAPAHVSTTTTVPGGHQIYWVSLIASQNLAPQTLSLNRVTVPLKFGDTPLLDFFVPATGKLPTNPQPVELTCATQATTNGTAAADCGVFGYYYQP